jgi:hypothetical protein
MADNGLLRFPTSGPATAQSARRTWQAGNRRPDLKTTAFLHSPTGFVPDRAYLEELIAVADRRGQR